VAADELEAPVRPLYNFVAQESCLRADGRLRQAGSPRYGSVNQERGVLTGPDRGESELRCWSAGCASGEEAYTLKLVWGQIAAARFPELRLWVLGTDADEAAVKRARRGCYAWSSLKELPPSWLDEGFERTGERWRVSERLRDGVEFRVQDLRLALPEERFHLVACRYLVFTYLDEPRQRATLMRLLERMVSEAVLVIGKTETLPGPVPAELVEWAPNSRIFRLQEA
jgi:chemotaxis protein methyltransferase CheR